MTEVGGTCYICSSNRYVEDHHYDCKGGEISPETVPLCKRCHRTYHDLGVEWFDDEYLDKAIEIENRRRQIFPLKLLTREDILRSDGFNKAHGIKPTKLEPAKEKIRFLPPGLDPLPGWDWYWAHHNDPPPPCEIVLFHDGKEVAKMTGDPKRAPGVKDIKRIMRSCEGD